MASVNVREASHQLHQLLRDGKVKEAKRLLANLAWQDDLQAYFVTGRFENAIRGYGKMGTVVTGETRDSNHAYPDSVPYVLYIGTKLEPRSETGIFVDTWSAFDKEVDRELGYSVLGRFEKVGLRPGYTANVLEGMLLAAQKMASHAAHTGFGANVERIVICSALFEDPVPLAKHFGLSAGAFKKPSKERRTVLNRYVERLFELGMHPFDVRDHFLDCLEHNAERRSLESVLRLAGAKCFEHNVRHDPKLARILHERYLQRFWQELTERPYQNQAALYPFAHLAQYGIVTRKSSDDQKMLRRTLTNLVSRGRTRQAWEIIDSIGGGALGLFDLGGHPDIGGGSGMTEQDCHDDYVKIYLESLVPEAFRQAREQEEWGNAAALVDRFGPQECMLPEHRRSDHTATEIAEIMSVRQKAIDTDKPIPMETESYYVRD